MKRMTSKTPYRRCTRCIMDNSSDSAITFNEDGTCNYCTDVLKRMPIEYLPNEEGKEKLNSIIEKIKHDGIGLEYDCIVGVSGGIDSSYILYLGYMFGLRMLAVHVNDGLDNPVASKNIERLIEKTGAHLIEITPDRNEYSDILLSLFKASVPSLANAQDNLIIASLQKYGMESGIRYSLDGSNFAHESILERNTSVNACDKKFIYSIHRKFGSVPIKKTRFISLLGRYVGIHITNRKLSHIRILNYIPYDLNRAIKELNDFCGFEYYGGKHYESILTRFMQCYYLPNKFGMDKRKSHFSSLIMSKQMGRDEALKRMNEPLYLSEEMREHDMNFLADYMGISRKEFDEILERTPMMDIQYPHSILNEMAPIARKFRRILE